MTTGDACGSPTERSSGSPSGLDDNGRSELILAHQRREDGLRNSPQYRVGEVVIAAARSPRRMLRLPVELWRLRRELLARTRPTPASPVADRRTRDVRAATVLDSAGQLNYAAEWDQHPLTTASPIDQLRTIAPTLVFVEATSEDSYGWFGENVADLRELVRDLLAAAATIGVPTVSWNTGDPAHFGTFADQARRFDWIFTTDANCVDRYRAVAGHDRIGALPFACQPRLHNPIGVDAARNSRACFIGRWRAELSGELATLLRPVLDTGLLDILVPETASRSGDDRFPAPYDKAVLGTHTETELVRQYGRYACYLSVESERLSPTACSPRVFEVLACRTPVVSTPSRAIDELFGGAVVTVDDPADALAAVEHLLSDTAHRDRIGHLGYRAVMSRHTYGHRVDELLRTIGLGAPTSAPRVAVLAPTNRPWYLDRLLENFARQQDVDAELIVLTNSDRFDRTDVDARVGAIGNAQALHLGEHLSIGECLNRGVDLTDARFVAKFDDDDHYGPHYLHDALLVHRYVNAAIVGKKTFFAHLEGPDETVLRFPGNEFTFANRVSGSTMLIDRGVFGDVRFAALNLGEDIDLCEQAISRELPIFSADRFNYVAARRADARSHSWAIADEDYRIGSVRVGPGLALDRTML